jgi:hypothetical protein
VGHRGLGWIFASLSVACAQGGPGASTGLTFGSLGEGGETTGGTTDATSDTSSASTGPDASTTGIDASGTGTTAAAPTCEDAEHNGDETDVDCGGSCPPCELGEACVDAVDCSTMLCEGQLCCLESTYERSTGQISGSASVCCDGSDERLSLVECGTGVNYSVQEEGANCASTAEGAMNNGTACVTVTCRMLSCSASDTGTT